jgi:hypothetical protein
LPHRSAVRPRAERPDYTWGVQSKAGDTDPDTERVHRELLRNASPSRRLHLALSLSQSVIALSRAGLAQRLNDNRPEEIGLRFVALHYGQALAEAVRRDLEARRR